MICNDPDRGFKVLGIDHLGIVPPSLSEGRTFLHDVLGIPVTGSETVADQGVAVTMLACASDQPRLELLEPIDVSSPIDRYLRRKGGGVHHIALRVDNITAAIAFLKSQGITLVDAQPRSGADGKMIAFVHPKSTGGILFELVQ